MPPLKRSSAKKLLELESLTNNLPAGLVWHCVDLINHPDVEQVSLGHVHKLLKLLTEVEPEEVRWILPDRPPAPQAQHAAPPIAAAVAQPPAQPLAQPVPQPVAQPPIHPQGAHPAPPHAEQNPAPEQLAVQAPEPQSK